MSRFPYNDCNECPHHNQASCPLSNFPQKEKERFCPSLKLRIKVYDDSHVNLMAERLLARLDAIKGIEPIQQEMDYNRNDTKQIVNSMRPYNN